MFYKSNNRLVFSFDCECVWIEAWGRNSLRVRATKNNNILEEEWALLPQPPCSETKIVI